MSGNTLRRVKLTATDLKVAETAPIWLWDGLLRGGELTLFVSTGKLGKTTLLAGLLRALGHDGRFLGQTLRRGRGLVASEEAAAIWASRVRRKMIGGHVELMVQPFTGCPAPEQWQALVDEALALRRRGELDLFVIDSLIRFIPGGNESNLASILAFVEPLRALAAEGCAVLVLHHPRKRPSAPGEMARGRRALLDAFDITLELNRCGQTRADHWRRTVYARSGHAETPLRLSYEWDSFTDRFTLVASPQDRQFEANWDRLQSILTHLGGPATRQEIRNAWPPGEHKPSVSTIYDLLNHAHALKRVQREGRGNRMEPWRWGL